MISESGGVHSLQYWEKIYTPDISCQTSPIFKIKIDGMSTGYYTMLSCSLIIYNI